MITIIIMFPINLADQEFGLVYLHTNQAEMRASADRLFDRFRLPNMPFGIDGTHIP